MCEATSFCLGCTVIPLRSTALVEPPKCPQHHVFMVRSEEKHQTAEQRYCGVWYECQVSGCHCGALVPSRELIDSHRGMCKRIKQDGDPNVR